MQNKESGFATSVVLALLLVVAAAGAAWLALTDQNAGQSLSSASPSSQLALASAPTAGLIGWWKLDDGSGSTAADSSGSGYNASLTNSPTWTTGNMGGALSFNAASSQYVATPSISLPASFTLSMWVKETAGGVNFISGQGYSWVLGGYYGKAAFSPNSCLSCGVISSVSINDGSWHLLTAVVSGSSVSLYVDGSAQGSAAATYSGSSGSIAFGGGAGAYYTGSIDDVRLYNWALGASDVQSIYQAGSGGGSGPTTYPISISTNGTGSGSVSCGGSACPSSVNSGTAVAFSATASAGSVFAGWSGACSGSSTPCNVTVNSNTSVTATFNILPINPPVVSNALASGITTSGALISWVTDQLSTTQVNYGLTSAYGSHTALDSSKTTSHSATISGLQANTTYHYQAASSNSYSRVGVSPDQTFTTAQAASNNYTVTVSRSGSGTGSVASGGGSINCGLTCSASAPAGTPVSLTATPSTGSTFVGWSGVNGCSTSNVCSFTLNANVNVTATFNANQTLDNQAPSSPSGLTASAVSSSQVNLTWAASSDNVGVAGYNIYRNGTKVGTSASTAYSDTGLAASTLYTYTVSAYDAAGNTSIQSSPASATTQANVVSGSCPAQSGKCWYVDSSVSSSGNGTSWSSAWKNISNITGVGAGDIVYISGGPGGSTRDYPISLYSAYPGRWIPAGGTASAPITYKIGQDSQHNGTAIFDGMGGDIWLVGAVNNVVISGDAGDGAMHFKLANYTSEAINNEGFSFGSNVRVSYVDFGTLGSAIDLNPGTSGPMEIDHTSTIISGATVDHWGFFSSVSGSGYDAIKIHDNTISLPRQSTNSGYGADGIQISGSGFSIYNNKITAYSASYSGNQHQDAIQMLGMTYVKIYGNTITDMNNSSIFGDNFSSPSHVRIYDNIMIGGGGGVEMGNDASAPSQAWTFNDIIVANNLDDSSNQGIGIGSHFSATFTNTLVANNIMVNANQITTGYNGQSSNNVTLTSAQAAADFANYSGGDYHLTSAATNLIGQGTNLYTYFTADKDGKTWPSTGAWDVGPYHYTGTPTNPAPAVINTFTASPNTVSSGQSSTLSWTSIGANSCNLNGGAYSNASVGANSSQVVTPSVTTAYSLTCTGTGGASPASTVTVTVGSIAVNPPSAPTNVSATAVSSSQINLAWTPSSAGTNAIAGYNIYMDGSQTKTGSAATASYSSTGLAAGSTHSYTVKAYDTAGNEGAASTIVSATTASAAQTGTIEAKMVGSDLTTATAPSGVWSQIDSGSQTSTNPSYTASISTGNHTVSFPNVSGYSEAYNTCTYAQGGTECSLPTASAYFSMACTASTCSATVPVTANTATKVAVLYTVTQAGDTTAPTVSTFTLGTPSSLTVPVSSLTASDNVGVTGYILTTSATAPLSTASGWTSTAPTSYTFSASGTYTLYAWAKDATGNVSASKSANVTVSGVVIGGTCSSQSGHCWYVDSQATGANTGASWTDAWTSFGALVSNYSKLSPGDIVYISGGPSGSTRTYVMNTGQTSGNWFPKGGAPGSPITYQIGQDSQHNGTAIFTPGTSGSEWIQASSNWGNANVVVSGDAGDGKMHFQTSGFSEPVGLYGPLQNFRVSYVNFGNTPIGPTSDNGSTVLGPGIEIDHTYAYINNTGADHYSAMWFGDQAYDSDSFHDNTLYVPRLASGVNSVGGDGADGLQWNGSGWSMYNNLLVAYVSSPAYSANQHQDGVQPEGGNYIKIYGNTIVNMANYGIYAEGLYGGFNHMKIYDNVILQNNSQAIAVGLGGSDYTTALDKDVIVANNFADGGSTVVSFWNAHNSGPTNGTSGAGLIAANNIGVGSSLQLDAGVASINNKTITSTQAAQYFQSYTPNAGVTSSGAMIDNLNLTSAGVTALTPTSGTSNNYSSYFTLDKGGSSWPSTGYWNAGPYQSGYTVTNPVPTASLSASSISIASGQSSTLTWSSTNANACTGTGFSTGNVVSNAVGVTVTPSQTTTYSLTCTGLGGTSLPSNVTVTVGSVAPQTGTIETKMVGSDLTAGSAPSGVWSQIDSGSQVTANPSYTANSSTGNHTVSFPNVSGYTESYDTCTYAQGGTECSLPTASAYTAMTCTASACSATIPVTANTTTKIVALYTATVVAPTTYTVTASAGTGGSISPAGTVTVNSGSSQSFAISPSTGYQVSSVTVDGSSVGAVSSYTFPSTITAGSSHTITASFSQIVSSGTCGQTNGTCYVDSQATGANNGSSWTNAWTSIAAITGLQPGTTVYISGGPSGSTRTYSVSNWAPTGGTSGSPVTYKIGQDSAHNGTAIFSGSPYWIHSNLANVVISGDAGDGLRHFSLANPSTGNSYYSEPLDYPGGSLSTNARISYVNFGNVGVVADVWPIGNNFEIDHTYAYVTGSGDHWGSFNTLQGTGWDQIRIHDNIMYLPHDSASPAYGDDGIQASGVGLSIYNNAIIGYNSPTYVSGGGYQHQDGWQGLSGSQIKIYNNLVYHMGDFGIFGDIYANSSDIWIYNNIVLCSGNVGCIAVGLDGGANSTVTLSDIVIANNIADADPSHQSISLNNVSTHTAVFTNDLVADNILINSSGISTQNNSTTPTPNNINLTSSQAQQYFASYSSSPTVGTNGTISNDYHLTSAATSLIGQGANESSVNGYTFLTSDRDGKSRPATGNWDVGPYQSGYTATNPAPTASLSASSISITSGQSSTLTWSSTNANSCTGTNFTASGISGSVTVTPSQTTTYSLTCSGLGVTSLPSSVTVTVGSVAANPPLPPTNLAASPVSPSEIDLSWTASAAGTNAVSGYYIYVNGATTPTATVSTASYKSTGLTANSSYSYQVVAYDTAGNKSQPSMTSATTWPTVSIKFSVGQQVQTIANANIRQQPSGGLASQTILGTQPAGAISTVSGGPLYGVLNSIGYYWWNLVFGSSPSGWVAEDNLQAYSAPAPTYSVGGSISGLSGTVTLQDNGGDSQTISANGSFAFTTKLLSGSSYAVTVSSQPSGQACAVTNGSGTVGSANVSNVSVACSNNVVISDSDGDGVPNSIDQCPNTPSGDAVNTVGCPMPIASNFTVTAGGSPLSVSSNLLSAPTFTISNSYGSIAYPATTTTYAILHGSASAYAPSDINGNVSITQGTISVNAVAAPELEHPAIITFTNIKNPGAKIYQDGSVCAGCTNVTYSAANKTLSFSVPDFTTYSVVDAGGSSSSYSSSLAVSVAGNGSGTAASSDGAIKCGSKGTACSDTVDQGTALTLSATPDAGSSFSGWSGACSGTNASCSLTLNANAAVTASFSLNPSGGGNNTGGTPVGGGSYNPGGGSGPGYVPPSSGTTTASTTIRSTCSSPVPSYVYSFGIGDRGQNVTDLQTFLSYMGFTKPQYVTGYFGPITKAALASYFVAHPEAYCPNGAAGSTAPSAQSGSSVCPPGLICTPISSSPASGGYVFARSLKIGMTGADVEALQKWLNAHGFPVASSGWGSPGHESTYYGPATAAAVSRFQEAYASAILAPYGLTYGTGYFGPSTIKVINGMQ